MTKQHNLYNGCYGCSKASGIGLGKKNAMTQARVITNTNKNCGLKRNWSLLQETRFYCLDTY